ncbi:MAG: cell division protein FtsZ [Rhodospirillales bacterium]|nr:cell division protein FtsZ [Rhodospirillales bacterium]
MSINLTVPDNNTPLLKPKLTVIGVGGAGGNAVNNMIRAQLEGVEFVVANTDAQSLVQSGTERRIQLGARLTAGLGAGSRPDVGRGAAEESIDDILAELDGVHMVFIAAGMGGGTGTGGAPVIARAAKEKGILTVGVVTKPFQFEGSHRMKQAEAGIEELEKYVDTLIVIPNQNLFRIANEKTTFADAFAMADEVLYSGVRGVTDLMVMPGLINLDFADIRSVMSEMGKAMMGTGEAEGERRALDAAEAAIANPLLDDTSMKGAKGVLINITGGMDITLFEVDEAANRIRAEVDDEAYIIVGSAFDPDLEGIMRVSVVATGIDINASQMALPTMLHLAEQLDSPNESRTLAVSRMEEPVARAIETEMESAPEPEPEMELEPEIGPIEESISESEPESELEFAPEPVDEESLGEVAEVVEPEMPPTGMPSVGAEDAYIPPLPSEVGEINAGQDSALDSEAATDAETMDGDAAAGASEEPQAPPQIPWRVKGVSLFERVTGSGKTAFGKKRAEPQLVEIKEVSSLVEAPVREQEEAEQPESANVTSLGASEEDSTQAEQSLGGMNSEERLPSSESTDDLLDIPAFLRRQAN